MNNEQLERSLRNLKSSSREPESIDLRLEERMMEEQSLVKLKRRRKRRYAVVLALVLVGGMGFVATGSDVTLMKYLASSTEFDSEGNPIENSESLWGYLLRHIHDHFHHRSRDIDNH